MFDSEHEEMFDTIPDEGFPERDELAGTSYLLQSGAHFYERIDLCENLLEKDIGKVPSHCQHMFGSMKKVCSMPGLYLQIESRIFQVWFDFLHLDADGSRVPVHMRFSNRLSRLRSLKKTKEDVELLYTSLGRELFLAYDVQFYLKMKGHYMNKKGFCRGNANVWKFEKFPKTENSFRAWVQNQGESPFLSNIASQGIFTFQEMKRLAFGINSPRESVNKSYAMLPSVLLASNVLSMIDLTLNWYSQNDTSNVTYKEDMWSHDVFFKHVFTNMRNLRYLDPYDNSPLLMWKLDTNGRIRLGREMKAMLMAWNPNVANNGNVSDNSLSEGMLPIEKPNYFIYANEQYVGIDSFFDILKIIFHLECHIGYIITNRILAHNQSEKFLYMPPLHGTKTINFGLLFDSKKAFKTCSKNAAKASRKSHYTRNAIHRNEDKWYFLDKQGVVFCHSNTETGRMKNLIESKNYHNIFTYASEGVITHDFLLFLIEEKTYYNKKIRKKERKDQIRLLRKRYKA